MRSELVAAQVILSDSFDSRTWSWGTASQTITLETLGGGLGTTLNVPLAEEVCFCLSVTVILYQWIPSPRFPI